MALYVYGLMRAHDASHAVGGDSAHGLDAIEHDGVGALVRSVPDGSVKLRRDSITSHSETLQSAFAHGPVLPMRFATVFPSAEAIQRELLAHRADQLLAHLNALDGKSEMQVKATYLEEPLLVSILGANPHLSRAAERIRELPPAATHFERISLGEAIGAAVDIRRDVDSRQLRGQLRPLALAVVTGELQNERMVLNASFLVDTRMLEQFDGAVERLSLTYEQHMQLTLIGPMPAYSFADHEWDGGDARSQSRTG